MSGYVCPKCGLDYDTISPPDAKVAIRSFPRRYRGAVAAALDEAEGDEALVRRRPQPDVWSALEYTAHAADIVAGSATWVRELLLRDDPTLTMPDGPMFPKAEGGDATIDEALDALATGAEDLAGQLDKVGTDDWHRTGKFPWGERDLLMTMRNAVHEGSHHLRDVEQVLDRVRQER